MRVFGSMRPLPLVAALFLLVACGSADGPVDLADAGSDDGGGRANLHGCRTACDCPRGQTCAGGDCISGLVAVYCCSDEACPPQEICQAPSGEVSLCAGLGEDPHAP